MDDEDTGPATNREIVEGLKIIWKHVRKYRREMVILSLLGIVSALGNGSIPYVTGVLFDSIISPESVTLLGRPLSLALVMVAVFFLVQGVTNAVDWISGVKRAELHEKAYVDYWTNAVDHIVHLPMTFHTESRTGETLMGKVNRTSGTVRDVVNNAVELAPQFLSIVVGFSLIFYIHPVMGLVWLTAVVLFVVVLFRGIRPLHAMEERYWDTVKDIYSRAFDMLGNIKEVKQAATEEYEHGVTGKRMNRELVPLFTEIRKVWQDLTLAQRTIIVLGQVAVFVLGIHFVRLGQLTVGELIAINAYGGLLFGPFIQYGRVWQRLQRQIVRLRDTEELLEMKREDYEPEDMVEMGEIEGKIEFVGVSFSYDEQEVLQDVSFEVEPGQTVAFVGRSGSGKSTIIDLISRYYTPDKGEINLDDIDLDRIGLKFLRSRIGVVSQDIVLFNDTIENNIRYGNFDVSDEEIREAAERAHCTEFIEGFPDGFDQEVGERGIQLSVGQKQRVAIARAFLKDPDILILDEPTSALDAETEKEIEESLEELTKDKTTLVIAHRLSTVRNADKILVLEDGTIQEEGTHEELKEKEDGLYRKLYEMQIGLYE